MTRISSNVRGSTVGSPASAPGANTGPQASSHTKAQDSVEERPRVLSDPHAAPILESGGVGAVDRETVDSNATSGVPLHPGSMRPAPAPPLPKEIQAVLQRHQLDLSFPAAVQKEVQALLAHPGIDDPSLQDLRHLPFVTIDNPGSKDLDQAMFIRRRQGGGFEVFYALADAAYYVRPGTALWKEATKRASSYYLPGLSVPMLPRELSEGLVSLNPGVERRALVFKMSLDAQGQCEKTEVSRARVQSRKKLTYGGVQRFHDDPKGSPLSGQAFTETLELLHTVGDLRIRDAQRRDVVHYDRVNLEVDVGQDGRLEPRAEARTNVDAWNEQISLLCNSEGAKLLAAGGARLSPGIFRVHPAPTAENLAHFDRLVDRLVRALDLEPKVWGWHREAPEGESLADYIARLPDDGANHRLGMAIQRQAMMLSQSSHFSEKPGLHSGVGARPYSRFSSPMRELVGIVTHHLLLDKLAGRPSLPEQLVEATIHAGDLAKQEQKRIDKEVAKVAIDELFAADLQAPEAVRPLRTGTVMGMSNNKLYVQLDSPPVEVKVYLDDLALRLGGPCSVQEGAELFDSRGKLFARTGSAISLVVAGYDGQRQRWILTPKLAS